MEIRASDVLEATIRKQFLDDAPHGHENTLMKIIRFRASFVSY